MPLDSPYLFGITVDGLRPDTSAAVDGRAFGWPAARLSALPAGDYLVQAVLNRYETFHLADGRVLKLPPDQGEGQKWQSKPGNLYSKPVRVHLDPAHAVKTALVLDQEIPAIERKTDTEFVRHVRIRSELLSAFWARMCWCPRTSINTRRRTFRSWYFTDTIPTISRSSARPRRIPI
jgi:hypothetical protein